MESGGFTSYREFWPFYLREHSRPGTRAMHFVGTSLAVILVALAIVFGDAWLLLGALIAGYGFAWIAHMTIERNQPATFKHPLYSLIGDFHMCALIWLGRLDEELVKANGGPLDRRS